MNPIVITIIGQDRSGLVDAIAREVYQHRGNWVASNFAQMAGQFAGFLEVHVSDANRDDLIAGLQSLQGIQVQSVTVAHSNASLPHQTIVIDVMGNDKLGIVQEITRVLHGFDLNIASLSSCCESAPNWGSLMFKASIIVDVPTDFDKDELVSALEDVANDLVVDISTYED